MLDIEVRTTPGAPRSTAPGALPRGGLPATKRTITKAIISVAAKPGQDWYLDTTVCGNVMALEYNIVTNAWIGTVFCFIAGAIGGCRR